MYSEVQQLSGSEGHKIQISYLSAISQEDHRGQGEALINGSVNGAKNLNFKEDCDDQSNGLKGANQYLYMSQSSHSDPNNQTSTAAGEKAGSVDSKNGTPG